MLAKCKPIQFLKQNKKAQAVVFYGSIFLVFLFLSTLFIYKFNTKSVWGIFASDSPRVYLDFTKRIDPLFHYRTETHPLYVVICFPVVKFFRILFSHTPAAIVAFVATFSTLNIFLFSKLLNKITKSEKHNTLFKLLFLLFYITSFPVIENLVVVESFVISLSTLLLFWNYFFHIKGKDLTWKNYIILLALGVLTYGITFTNFVHFVIGTAFLILFNKKKTFKEFAIDLLKMVALLLAATLVILGLSLIQNAIFKTARNPFKFITDWLLDFLGIKTNPSGDTSFKFKFAYVLNTFIYTFSYSFVGFNPIYDPSVVDNVARFNGLSIFNIIYAVLVFALFVFCIVRLIKNKSKLWLPLAISLLFEIVLHSIYGGSEPWLYPLGYSFITLVIIYMGLTEIKHTKVQKTINYSLIPLTLLNIGFGILMLDAVRKATEAVYHYSISSTISIYGLICLQAILLTAITFVAVNLINLALKQRKLSKEEKPETTHKKPIKILSIALAVLLVIQIALPLALYFVDKNRKKDPIDFSEQNKIAVFGMGLRKKYVLENTNDGIVFYEFEPISKSKTTLETGLTFISYNSTDYEAKLTSNDGKNIKIYENENGIYYDDGSVTALDESQHINIPDFSSYQHANYLKILFHELMINITSYGLSPNIFVYGNTWYRDGAIMAMVLEKTNNTRQIYPWLNSLTTDDIYDNSRDPQLDETDNLGELLYLLSLSPTPDPLLVDAIIEEARRLKVDGTNYISGITDGGEKPEYQTKWLIYGLQKLGLPTNEFSIDGASDDYADLCWFYDRKTKQDFENVGYNYKKIVNTIFDYNKESYPYINWAKLHYYNVKVELPELTYPISFEIADYPNRRYCFTHGWCAAEMFLYLLDYNNYS